ncbi:MAG TPA: CHASE2 domain-containing protein, partial [Opitutales bacterium]|nr:CHASE2 domain-containing protein [Opitutales bacterium]
MSRTRQLIAYAALIVMSAALWLSLSLSGLLDGLEQEALRWRYVMRGELPAEAPPVFLNIDPLTVAKMGDRPWDRLNFAQTLEALLGPGKARAVAVDIIFSPMGTGSLLDVERARKGDFRLGEVVERYRDKVVLAAAYTATTAGVSGLPLRRLGYQNPADVPFPEAPTFPIIKFDSGRLGLVNVDEALNKGSIPHKVLAVVETEGEGFSEYLAYGQCRYIDSFNDQSRKARVISEDGFLKVPDPDNFIHLDPIPAFSSHRLLALGLEVFLAAHGLDSSDAEWTEGALIIRKEAEVLREVPLVKGQTLEVNWLQGWDIKRPGEHYSLAEVLEKANALGAAAAAGDAEAVADWE